ncbi:formate dehydrogenase accessory sulfurtransferase FdhD [Microbacterium sp. MPKO10]|uniref:formate dehydrogenase accessory sulfurtransferase FdhD n=1 Tax=Microbacterium sp. MPKO10 TaxID=2989818 RepID=UPI0022355A74|nr:formate dehydrogenase accessory sulfurtransferase FdhD [Microbacterium sp. MPKO10]MCW4459007.1 formate dehydrogenase accessory sulfurtransferase FdhD [Microbacterium sp. MPKO10]
MGRITARRRVARYTVGERTSVREDHLAVEEPLEIRVGGRALTITMRTPGSDVELATGFLLSEGIVSRPEHVRGAMHCASDDHENTYNVLDVTLDSALGPLATGLERAFTTTSSCGLCGKASIDAVRTTSAFNVHDDDTVVDAEFLTTLPVRLRAGQSAFDKTGGLHAAALFDARTGDLLVLREDVGRHNAVDKVTGWALSNGVLPGRGLVLVVSGRASFELTQKAFMAGIPILAAVSAPSSLAAEMAEDVGLSLVGFVRDNRMVVYAGARRVTNEGAGSVGTAPATTGERARTA